MSLTPMMEQYLEVKRRHPDAIVFYRLGDFYEMFFDDAKLVSRELELTLTGRDCGGDERAPMCGVPYHSADSYIAKLVSRGYKVVICEQMEDPATAKGLVRRDVVRIITPGTVIDSGMLDEKRNNYIAALCLTPATAGVCFCDVSTGDIDAAVFDSDETSGIVDRVLAELARYEPRELLCDTDLTRYPKLREYLLKRISCSVADNVPARFEPAPSLERVRRQFPDRFSAGDSLPGDREWALIRAVGAVLGYIEETQRSVLGNITDLSVYDERKYLELDPNTRRSLELCETMRTGEHKGSLLWALDRTKTSAGARLLRRFIEAPLIDCNKIARRQGAVGELASSFILRRELAEHLSRVLDLERLTTKIVYNTAGPRDLKAVSSSASVIPEIKALLADCRDPELCTLRDSLDELADVRDDIERTICDDPPFSVRDGGFIRPGANEEADRLREIVHDAKSYIERIAAEERDATGIKNLKIGYNRVFGYYIEVSKSNLSSIPAHYIRKQTLAGGERFITEKLKETEQTILGASDRLAALELELFSQLRERLAEQAPRIQRSAATLALLDVYCSLGEVASEFGYCRPEVDYSDIISIKEGRHPVVERFTDGMFVPNDTMLDSGHNRLMLITGPNMAGKSTYMRQVALIVLMAQIGSFVPASSARIGIVDKIFTRVGASDDLAAGTSTFMLEMNEVAYILSHATKRSLIIYDEIGRGTSTFDGMSIARAVAEYTASRKIGAKTLFATHYHELTDLEGSVEGIFNCSIAAKKKGDDIIFLRKIVRGATDDSYGIEVAKLAGVPKSVIRRAREVLGNLEQRARASAPPPETPPENAPITIDDIKAAQVREKLVKTDIDLLTPLEALNLLSELKKLAE